MQADKKIPSEYDWIKPGVRFKHPLNGFTATVSKLPVLIEHPKRPEGVWIVFFEDPSHERIITSSYCEHIKPVHE